MKEFGLGPNLLSSGYMFKTAVRILICQKLNLLLNLI